MGAAPVGSSIRASKADLQSNVNIVSMLQLQIETAEWQRAGQCRRSAVRWSMFVGLRVSETFLKANK